MDSETLAIISAVFSGLSFLLHGLHIRRSSCLWGAMHFESDPDQKEALKAIAPKGCPDNHV